MDAHSAMHPPDATLRSYRLGKLDEARAREVDRHLEQCEGCRKRIAGLPADSYPDRVRDVQRSSSKSSPAFSESHGLKASRSLKT
jgi:anti-sigma factor RsiW